MTLGLTPWYTICRRYAMTPKTIRTMTVTEAADYLGKSRQTIYIWTGDPAHKLRWAAIEGSVRLLDAESVEAEKALQDQSA